VSLFTAQGAIVGWLKTIGVTAKLSEPGHIAQQMLEHLGGLWGVGLLADCETLQLLNKMAGGTRLRRNDDQTIEEQFPLRTATLKDWTDLIARRKGKTRFGGHPLEQFVKRNIIRLGLETDCPNCKAQNWTTLSAVDYQIECERCLKPYAFPQAALRDRNRNWTYRVIGPFTAPDFGRGSYSALLALRALNSYRASGEWMTFATAMTLSFDGVEREVDLIAWKGDDKFDVRRQPRLVIGEAKSLGSGELITKDEIAKLKSVAAKLPDAVVVIAVLRDHFTKNEKKLLTKFVTWGRTPNSYGEPSNPVLLLTSTELLMEHSVTTTWKHLGGKHAQFSSFREMRNLLGFANVTQQLYLDMPSFGKWLEERWKKRLARRQKRASVQKTP
jgi:hypothetical protein